MSQKSNHTTEDFLRALDAVLADDVNEKHLEILRTHLSAPGYAATWEQLATAVGYANGNAINLQYGKLAERIATQLGYESKPIDSNGNAWWLWVLVDWAKDCDPESGHTVFVLRTPFVEALQQRIDLTADRQV